MADEVELIGNEDHEIDLTNSSERVVRMAGNTAEDIADGLYNTILFNTMLYNSVVVATAEMFEGRGVGNMDVRRFTRGDLINPLRAQLLNADRTPCDLTDSTVVFRMREAVTGEVKVDSQPAQIDNASEGRVHYDWEATDIDTEGVYWGQFKRTYNDETEHFPVGKELKIVIEEPI